VKAARPHCGPRRCRWRRKRSARANGRGGRKAAAELQQERAAIVRKCRHHGATIRAGTQGAQGIALAEVVEGAATCAKWRCGCNTSRTSERRPDPVLRKLPAAAVLQSPGCGRGPHGEPAPAVQTVAPAFAAGRHHAQRPRQDRRALAYLLRTEGVTQPEGLRRHQVAAELRQVGNVVDVELGAQENMIGQ